MRNIRLLGVAAACLIGLSAVGVFAQDTSSEQNIKGTVAAVRDEGGKITAVTLTSADDRTYSVTLDATGSDLGEKMDGKAVAVKGTVSEKDDIHWLTVKSYEGMKVGDN